MVLKMATGTWSLKYPGFTFKLLITPGGIIINGKKIPIPRMMVSYGKHGWLHLRYLTWTFNIRMTLAGLLVRAYNKRKPVPGKVVKVGGGEGLSFVPNISMFRGCFNRGLVKRDRRFSQGWCIFTVIRKGTEMRRDSGDKTLKNHFMQYNEKLAGGYNI